MLRVGIIGARGYAGEELIAILLKHSQVKINYLTARLEKPVAISEILPHLKGKIDLTCNNFELKEALRQAELFFLALPHTASMGIAPSLLKAGKRLIDLSADYRIKNHRLYETWYKVEHKDRESLKKSVYGLPEIYGTKIKKTNLVANPGCYPTASILALAPILSSRLYRIDNIIIDAKSGYSGAGRKSLDDSFWQELKDNFKAYKVDSHQHSVELSQEFYNLAKKNINFTFVPHLVSVERGILETIYVKVSPRPKFALSKGATTGLVSLYKKFYQGKPFVRIKEAGEFPSFRDVQHTNFCDIGIKLSEKKKLIIIISAIDNLVKGASGQAVQNMNLMYGFKETEGLL